MRTILIAILCFSELVVHSQDKAAIDVKFNHLALAVKDLNRSVEFYQKVFQLGEIKNGTANSSIRWLSLGEGKELHLINNHEPVTVTKTIHLALTSNNLEAFQKRLAELNVAYGDWAGKPNAVTTRADGIKQIYLQDPDGYWIEINNARN